MPPVELKPETPRSKHSTALIPVLTLIMLNYFMHYTPPYFYPVNLKCFLLLLCVENSVDPDHLTSEKLYCFNLGYI